MCTAVDPSHDCPARGAYCPRHPGPRPTTFRDRWLGRPANSRCVAEPGRIRRMKEAAMTMWRPTLAMSVCTLVGGALVTVAARPQPQAATSGQTAGAGQRGRRRPRRYANRRSRESADRRLGHECTAVDGRGWGWMTQVVRQREVQASLLQQGEGAAVQRQAGHQLHDRRVRSGALLRGAQALRLTSGSRCSTARCRGTTSRR